MAEIGLTKDKGKGSVNCELQTAAAAASSFQLPACDERCGGGGRDVNAAAAMATLI